MYDRAAVIVAMLRKFSLQNTGHSWTHIGLVRLDGPAWKQRDHAGPRDTALERGEIIFELNRARNY